MDVTLAEVLRVHPEPFGYVDEWTVHATLTSDPEGYLGFLEDTLARIATGHARVELPPKLLFNDGEHGGDFRVMPCVVREGKESVKTVKLVGTNVRQKQVPDQVTVGKAFRLDPDENYITHVFEACLLSSARTGACAAVAVRKLAERPRQVAIVGAGRVGYYAALYMSFVDGVEEIVVRDVRRQRAQAVADSIDRTGPGRLPACRAAAPSQQGPIEADVVILATTSKKPFLAPGDVTAPLTVSTGADTEDQHELTEGWAATADLYVDSRDCALVGDLRIWLDKGLLGPERLMDLLTLFREGASPANGSPRLFISTGSGLLDNLTIGYLLQHCGWARSPPRVGGAAPGRGRRALGFGRASEGAFAHTEAQR